MKKKETIKRSKIFDCITFFNENFITNIRFEILDAVVDFFIICESIYDHKGNKKKINFKLKNIKFKKKIIHIITKDKFPLPTDPWKNQALQREKIFEGLKDCEKNDYVMFSDPDEIPNPNLLKNIFLRKNLKYPFWRIDKEKDIEVFENGGWHFNNLMSPEDISLKIKTFAHSEYNNEHFFDINLIKKKIIEKKDLYNRNRIFNKVRIIKKNYPSYILNNLHKFINFIH